MTIRAVLRHVVSRAQIIRYGSWQSIICNPLQTIQIGGYRVKRQAQYVTVRGRTRCPVFTRLSKLFVPGTSLGKPASCQWVCR